MQNINFNIHFIVPITHKFVPLHVIYEQKIIFEHLIMPQETGISKQVNFLTLLDTHQINVSQLKIINTLNNMPVVIEIVKINDIVQNIIASIPKNQKQIYLDTFFKASDTEATLFKIIGLPSTVSVSHSYLCNDNLYVPKCDRQNSILSFNNDNDDFKFKFVVEFFNTNITQCLCRIDCYFKGGIIETTIKYPYKSNISQLHEHLKSHYEEICNEEFIQNTHSSYRDIPIIPKAEHLKIAFTHDITPYSVIRIEGLPEDINTAKYELFYQNGAYYISNQNKALYHYLLSQATDNSLVTISYYNDNTVSPVFKSIFLNEKETDNIKKSA